MGESLQHIQKSGDMIFMFTHLFRCVLFFLIKKIAELISIRNAVLLVKYAFLNKNASDFVI